jgi:hypothetical protein
MDSGFQFHCMQGSVDIEPCIEHYRSLGIEPCKVCWQKKHIRSIACLLAENHVQSLVLLLAENMYRIYSPLSHFAYKSVGFFKVILEVFAIDPPISQYNFSTDLFYSFNAMFCCLYWLQIRTF